MSEREACSSFNQHAWKKDLCVDCGRLRSAHSEYPKPAKRLSKGPSNYKAPVNQTKVDHTTGTGRFEKQATPPREKPDLLVSNKDHQEDNNQGSDGGHYYHTYDVTQKVASGAAVSPETVKRNKAKESAKTAAFVHTFIPVEDFSLGREQKYNESVAKSKEKLAKHQRVVEVAAAEQNVALPYTIVDVSTIPHDVDPDSLEAKPQAPENPPAHPATVPRRAKPRTVMPGHGTAPSSKRQDLSAKRDAGAKKDEVKEGTNNISNASSKEKIAPKPTILYEDDHNCKDTTMSPNSQRKVAIMIPSAPLRVSHVYEDIDGESGESPKSSRKNGTAGANDKKKTAQQIKIMETNKFDANMQAIAKNLDLKKDIKTPETVLSVSMSEKEPPNQESKEVKSDKTKKAAGTGKGFLSRFFSKGSKSEDPQTDTALSIANDIDLSTSGTDQEWTRSHSVDCSSESGKKVGSESPVNRVRKTVARSDSTKEQTALHSELKTFLVKGAPKPDRSSVMDTSTNKVSDLEKGKDMTVSVGEARVGAKPEKTKKPEVVAKPEKPKKPERGKKPETPLADKKISLSADKPSIGDKPQVSKPISPVKPKPTRRAKNVEQRASEAMENVALTCDTSDKSIVQESPISPGKLEISMPKLEQSTINVEMISSLYSNISSDPSLSPREPQSPRSDIGDNIWNDKGKATDSPIKSRPKSELIKARGLKRMSAAPPPPPEAGPGSPPPTMRTSAVSPLPDVAYGKGVPNDLMTMSFDRSFTHSTLPKHFERPKIPETLPPEKAARNRRQAKAEKNGTGRSATLTEGINLEPNGSAEINFKDKESDKTEGGKFIDRALPSPPRTRRPQRDNIYEDIDGYNDGYYDDIVELTKSISIESGASELAMDDKTPDATESNKSMISSTLLSATGSVMTSSAEYMEPISRSESTSGDSITNLETQDPITNDLSLVQTSPITPTTPTNDADATKWGPNSKAVPDSYETGFLQMDMIHTRTLQSIVNDVCWEPQVIHDRRQGRLSMADFKMESKTPVLSHSSCMFYKVSTTKLEDMNNCILMISQKKAPTALTNCNNMNILKPVAVFSENAQLDSKPGTYAQAATVGVFNFSDVCSLNDHLKQKFGTQPTVPQIKQNTVIYVLIQVLNGLLWMVENNIAPRSLTPADILVVTSTSTTDQRLLLNPFRVKDPDKKLSKQDLITRLYGEFVKLALHIVSAERADKIELSKVFRSAGYADHSTALSHALSFENGVKQENVNLLKVAQQILEISLWGPSLDQLGAMLGAGDPSVACHVWLAIQRCTILSSHAVQGCSAAASWENTAYLNFLSACTADRLLEIAKKIVH